MYSQDNPPPVSAFIATINELKPRLSGKEIELLRYQFQQTGRAVTSQQVRELFDFSSIGSSNLLYGGLGKKFSNLLPMRTYSTGEKRTHRWRALAVGDGRGAHFRWIMREALAEALVKTGIVDPDVDGNSPLPDPDVHADNVSAVEGGVKLKSHLRRERNQAIISAKKENSASLTCVVCGFDFSLVYGVDYCEVHHLIPLRELDGETETNLDDLAVLCANCHRVVHLYSPPLTLDQLRAQITRRRGGGKAGGS